MQKTIQVADKPTLDTIYDNIEVLSSSMGKRLVIVEVSVTRGTVYMTLEKGQIIYYAGYTFSVVSNCSKSGNNLVVTNSGLVKFKVSTTCSKIILTIK